MIQFLYENVIIYCVKSFLEINKYSTIKISIINYHARKTTTNKKNKKTNKRLTRKTLVQQTDRTDNGNFFTGPSVYSGSKYHKYIQPPLTFKKGCIQNTNPRTLYWLVNAEINLYNIYSFPSTPSNVFFNLFTNFLYFTYFQNYGHKNLESLKFSTNFHALIKNKVKKKFIALEAPVSGHLK